MTIILLTGADSEQDTGDDCIHHPSSPTTGAMRIEKRVSPI